MSAETQPQTMTEAEWHALGEKLFGAEMSRWRFVCPSCHVVASIEKARALPAAEIAVLRAGGWRPESECIGRYFADRGCDWCAYGLLHGPFFVEREDGRKTPCFGFYVPPA